MARLPRIFAPLSLSVLLVSSLTACGNTDNPSDSGDSTSEKGKDAIDSGKNKKNKKKNKKKKKGPEGGPDDIPQPEKEGGDGSGGNDCDGPDGEGCFPIDIVFVVDNSGTMGEEQKNLAANFSKLVEKLKNLKNIDGSKATPSVHMMVTNTDVGHPSCLAFQPKGFKPKRGAPVTNTCLERLPDFETLPTKDGTKKFFGACEDVCDSKSAKPKGNFISFGPGGKGSNVPADDISKALSCVGPQGVNGCGYEAPLEAMMQSLNTSSKWNSGKAPFLRKGSLVAVVIVTDEADCSVRFHSKAEKSGFIWFTDPKKDDFCEEDPDKGDKKSPSSAICWNAGVKCSGLKGDVYKKCVATNLPSDENPVLQPISRYTEYFDWLREHNDNEIVMLGILGVPLVTKHNDKAPFEPIEGGVKALKYRKWRKSDLPKDTANAEEVLKKRQWDFGIGPGCTGDGTGQGIPPVRIKEVCEHLNVKDKKGKVEKVRCCIESICDDDFSNAINCLSGLIETIEPPK